SSVTVIIGTLDSVNHVGFHKENDALSVHNQAFCTSTAGLCAMFSGSLSRDFWSTQWTDCGGQRGQTQEGLHRCVDLQLLPLASCADRQFLLHSSPSQTGCGSDRSCRLELVPLLESQQGIMNHLLITRLFC
ncbi:hypothetical protein DNTS_008939, partial [Danionella cerebrum]